jgi:GYF domain 2
MAAELWYYTNEGKQMDPVSIKELKRLVSDGVLKPTDMIWKEGMARWIRASSLKELYPDPTAALDHFFTHTKVAASQKGTTVNSTSSTSVTVGASINSKTAPAVGSSSSGSNDDASQPSVKRRRSDEDRETSKGGGKGGLILIGVGLLAVGFLFFALLVGGGIVYFVTRPSEPAPAPQPIANQNDPKDKQPNDPPPKKDIPLPADVKTGIGKYEWFVGPGQQKEFKLRVKGGTNASVSVTNLQTKFKGTIDFNIFVVKDNNGEAVTSDVRPDINAQVQFTLPNDEIVRVRVVNAAEIGTGPRAKCAVEYNGG